MVNITVFIKSKSIINQFLISQAFLPLCFHSLVFLSPPFFSFIRFIIVSIFETYSCAATFPLYCCVTRKCILRGINKGTSCLIISSYSYTTMLDTVVTVTERRTLDKLFSTWTTSRCPFLITASAHHSWISCQSA